MTGVAKSDHWPGAVSALATIGGPAGKSALRKFATNASSRARLLAGMYLAEQGDASGKAALLEGLHVKFDPRHRSDPPRLLMDTVSFSDQKYRIAHDLIGLGYGHTQKELDDLIEGSGSDRRRILPELAAKPWPHVKPALIRILGDQNEYHGNRKWAATALGQSHYRPAVPALIAALNDPVRAVRNEAITALVDIGDKRAIKALESAGKATHADDQPRWGTSRPPPMTASEAAEILRRKQS